MPLGAMRYPINRLVTVTSRSLRHGSAPSAVPSLRRHLFSGASTKPKRRSSPTAVIVTAGFLIWALYPSDDFASLSPSKQQRRQQRQEHHDDQAGSQDGAPAEPEESDNAWDTFASRFANISAVADAEWAAFSDKIVGFILPEWSKQIPGYVRKLQRELSMDPGSLADEIWQEAHDPAANPEIEWTAKVRVSNELCDDEKEFLARRKKNVRTALAKYLGLKEKDIHPDDIPTIAMCGSGGGLRALIAGTGSLLATQEEGLFDCVTYTAGVSGSCWLQTLYLSSFAGGNIKKLLEHLKSRTSTHIAYPPVALQSLTSLPTSKHLLSGVVEKLKGDKNADFGLVDVYGLLLGARFLVPKGELGVNEKDFKISNQRGIMQNAQRPLPIYTAVRHEIPGLENTKAEKGTAEYEAAKEEATKKAWFQWFELTPYEVFCEEIGAGIPTWALGRKFKDGKDVPLEHGFHLPEIRTPILMGIFGSAFCATLSHYYKEIRPVAKSIAGFSSVDELISGRDDDLSKIHPIDPATIPNYAYQMYGKLPSTATKSIYESEHIQLMDAGMSNNLPIYPLLRPGRDVAVLVTFDASADIKTDNWLAVADGYAKQRGVKGWPIGVGWPKEGESKEQTKKELSDAQTSTRKESDEKLKQAKADQAQRDKANDNVKSGGKKDKYDPAKKQDGDLGYCTVWVGSTEERTSTEEPTPTKPITDEEKWRMTHPNAGLTLVYLPFMANDKVPGVSPGESDFMSTWNFIYTPEQIQSVVDLARANFNEGKVQIRSTIRAVYERKKQLRLSKEEELRLQRLKVATNKKESELLAEGDQFS